MPIPTQEPIPRLIQHTSVEQWAMRLTDFFNKNLLSFALTTDVAKLVNGNNHNVDIRNALFLTIQGPTTPFTITGIGSGSPGRIIIILNRSAGAMTLANANTGSAVNNRIITFTGSDEPCIIAFLLYSQDDSRWVMIANR